MKQRPADTTAAEAQNALDAIREMERAAGWRAMPPRWFGALIALLTGALVALSVADLRDYHVLIIVAMVLVMTYQSQKTGVSVKQFPSRMLVIGLGILVPLFFLLVVAGQLLTDRLGVVAAPLSAGAVQAAVVLTLSVLERRRHLDRMGRET